MNPRVKLILMNCAVVAALAYRWHTGTPLAVLAVVALVMFALVNGLLWLSQRKFNQQRRSR